MGVPDRGGGGCRWFPLALVTLLCVCVCVSVCLCVACVSVRSGFALPTAALWKKGLKASDIEVGALPHAYCTLLT